VPRVGARWQLPLRTATADESLSRRIRTLPPPRGGEVAAKRRVGVTCIRTGADCGTAFSPASSAPVRPVAPLHHPTPELRSDPPPQGEGTVPRVRFQLTGAATDNAGRRKPQPAHPHPTSPSRVPRGGGRRKAAGGGDLHPHRRRLGHGGFERIFRTGLRDRTAASSHPGASLRPSPSRGGYGATSAVPAYRRRYGQRRPTKASAGASAPYLPLEGGGRRKAAGGGDLHPHWGGLGHRGFDCGFRTGSPAPLHHPTPELRSDPPPQGTLKGRVVVPRVGASWVVGCSSGSAPGFPPPPLPCKSHFPPPRPSRFIIF
jgi:hypothetical protein